MACASRPVQLEQLPLQVRRHQDVHGRAGREHEGAVGYVVGAGVDEVGEHVVLVAGAQEHVDGRAHAPRVPGSQDVAEVSGGDAHVDGRPCVHLPREHQFGVGGHVVHDLRHEASPVDGVGAGQRHALGGKQAFGERGVGKHALDAGLAIVEVAAHGPHLHVLARLRHHLLALDVAYAAVGEQHADAHPFGVLEPFQCGLARVARSGHQDEELVIKLAALAQCLRARGKEPWQALQGHVLERAGGAVPQLQHVGLRVERREGADALVVEVLPIGLRHEGVHDLVRQVDVERPVYAGGALRIGKVGQRQDVFQGERGNALGHVQPASLRQPVDDGFREGDRTVCAPARVDVEVLSHVLHFLPNSIRVISDSSIKVSEHKINLEDHFFGFPQTCASRAPARGPLLPAFAVRRLPHHPLPIRAPAFASRHLPLPPETGSRPFWPKGRNIR